MTGSVESIGRPAQVRRSLFRKTGRVIVFAVLLAFLALAGLVLFSSFEAWNIARRYPPRGGFVAIDGSRLHYTQRLPKGEPRGTVVLLHGASGNQADLMVPLGDRLAAQGVRVIAFDRPGHGWSDRPDGESDASPGRQSAMIAQAMGRLGLRRAIVVGHSWSGALAANLALDHTDVTGGLVLLSGVTHPWTTGVAWYYGLAGSPWIGPLFTHTVTVPLGLALLPAGIDEVFAPGRPPPDFSEQTGLPLVLRPRDFMANAQDVAHLLGFVTAQAPRMKEIHMPTAIVTGDSDHIVSTKLHAFADVREIPDATLLVLPGVGHSPHWVDPDAVTQAILGVVDRVSALEKASGDTTR